MRGMRKGVIFDLDGTLWDANEAMAASYEAFVKKHLPEWYAKGFSVTAEKTRLVCGRPMEEFKDIVFAMFPEELRRIVQDSLIPAEWQPDQGPYVIYRRTRMLMSWMATPWGEADMPQILDTLSAGGFTQQLLLLRLFLLNKDDIHFSRQGQYDLGHRYFKAYQKITNQQ